MSISRIKQIKRILKDHDARDPRGAILAIIDVIEQPKAKPKAKINPDLTPKPVATIRVFDNPKGNKALKSVVAIDYNGEQIEPRHLAAAFTATRELGDELFGGDGEKCEDPNCPVHGKTAGNNSLRDLLEQFNAEAQAATGIKKENLQ